MPCSYFYRRRVNTFINESITIIILSPDLNIMNYYPSVRYVLLLVAGTTAGVSLFQKLSNESVSSTDLHEERRNLRVFPITFADPKSVSPRSGVYPPFVTSATKCAAPISAEDIEMFSRSQNHEDEYLMKWFSNLCGGTYIELGALDGVRFSNSHLFHHGLQWKGVLIELIESNYNKLVKNRPNEIATVHAGVCSEPQILHYVAGDSNAVGGIYEFSTSEFREKWWKDISLAHPSVKEIECDTMDSLLLKHAPDTRFFDFLSLDVEGAELAVLESIDFDRVGFGIVFAEADNTNELKNLAMRELMESKGYNFLFESHKPRSYWWANKEISSIYKDLVY